MYKRQGYKSTSAEIDINGDGIADFAFIPSGAETVAEIYYRYHISPQFELSPDFQWLTQGGANPDAKSAYVFGLRANIVYSVSYTHLDVYKRQSNYR